MNWLSCIWRARLASATFASPCNPLVAALNPAVFSPSWRGEIRALLGAGARVGIAGRLREGVALLLLLAPGELHQDRRGADAAAEGALEHVLAGAIRRRVDPALRGLVERLLHLRALGLGVLRHEPLEALQAAHLQIAHRLGGRRTVGQLVAAEEAPRAAAAIVRAAAARPAAAAPREGLAGRADAPAPAAGGGRAAG